ncbi:MAG: transketolase [bacterium]
MSDRRRLANAIRALSMDAVQAANSGHPGAPMGMADIAEVLWNDYMTHNPSDPSWSDRDRFVLSNGHGSMLIYSLLHLTGYDLPIEELKNFRQWGSKTAGHPEYGHTPGVETTTGPLGQGITNAVGMAVAEKVMANQFNREGHTVVDHRTWAFMGDGCLMEGISHEACSLAGTWKLGKLTAFWDDNHISIDGDVQGWFTDNTPERFESYGWQVIRDVDGHNADSIKAAIEQANAETEKPTLICCRTVIGFGSPNKQGTSSTHGAPLGDDEIAATRKELGWNYPAFEIPEDVYAAWDGKEKGKKAQSAWDEKFAAYKVAHPELAAEFVRRMAGDLPEDWEQNAMAEIMKLDAEQAKVATRKASQMSLNAFGPLLPELAGGSADLAGSNLTFWSGSEDIMKNGENGNYFYFGVREFGMTAICNGMALHGGFLPYSATFLVFSDYARNAVRMSALLPVRNIHVYTHDSIGLGEDGPTHQPIEHVESLRLIPDLSVWRPCDLVESAMSWKCSIEAGNKPSALIFTRQGLPHQNRSAQQISDIAKGGYVLKAAENAKMILIATGSEVELAMAAAEKLDADGIATQVVSMPCVEAFDQQDQAYKDSVLPPSIDARVAIEAGSTSGWYRFVGRQGAVVGIDHFGASAPANILFEKFGFTVENVVNTAKGVV